MSWTCDQLFVSAQCLWGRPLQPPAGKVKGFENWWQKWLLHNGGAVFYAAVTLQSNKDKIMQITLLSDGPVFLPASCCSVAIIAVFWENCLACFQHLYFSAESNGNLRRGKKQKSQAIIVGCDYTDSLLLSMLDESSMLPTFFSFLFFFSVHHNIFFFFFYQPLLRPQWN